MHGAPHNSKPQKQSLQEFYKSSTRPHWPEICNGWHVLFSFGSHRSTCWKVLTTGGRKASPNDRCTAGGPWFAHLDPFCSKACRTRGAFPDHRSATVGVGSAMVNVLCSVALGTISTTASHVLAFSMLVNALIVTWEDRWQGWRFHRLSGVAFQRLRSGILSHNGDNHGTHSQTSDGAQHCST